MIDKDVERLARELEEPRALRLLAEWLAIDHDETRLQYEKYMESAQELYDYITVIMGYKVKHEYESNIKPKLLKS